MKPRILGRHVNLLLFSDDFNMPIDIGELDEFSATSSTEIIKTRPVGYFLQGVTTKYAGYELSFKIGKTNPLIEKLNYLIEKDLLKSKQPPNFYILETIRHYDGTIENWIYKNVTLYGLDIKTSGEGDYEQNINGFAAYKELGPIDLTFLSLQFIRGIGIQEFVFRADREQNPLRDISAMIDNIL
jgi:hypothetical protein